MTLKAEFIKVKIGKEDFEIKNFFLCERTY